MAAEEAQQELPEVSEAVLTGSKSAAEAGLDVVMDVPLRLSVEIGSTQLLVREILQLDRMNGEPADIYVNKRLIARGEVTVVDEKLAVKLVEVVSAGEPVGRTR